VAKPGGAVGGLQVVPWAGFKGAISYTFDDNMQSQITHYAALNAVGVPMTFYLVCGTDGGNAIWTKAAKDGHELGNHTMHHCYNSATPNCAWGSFTGADAEIDDCSAHIKSAFGVTPYTMAAPFGDGAWAIPASERFLLNRSINDVGVPPDGGNPFALPCHLSNNETAEDIPATGSTPAIKGFNSITDDVRAKGTWRTILVHSVDSTLDAGYNPVKLTEMVKAMTYTKNLGDVWADTVLNVGAYWRAQKTVSAAKLVTAGTEKTYSWTLPEHFPPGHHLRITVTGGKVTQCGTDVPWDAHGYYEINLDDGGLTISP
jgi:peptidoglycan/xylan/chitin deacetylase (PgdA/CDA1 family)